MRSQRIAAACLAAITAMPTTLMAQAPDLEHEGAAALGLALRRLGVTQRVLMIGAHPDDENSALLATLALGGGANVAYLSLTRGEGGQNRIGAELQEGLGLIRSEELLAARRLDGARQFFSRAYDYGYSKSADEAFRHWPRDSLLSDVVAIVRRFRPDVMVPVFSGTPRDGHGQHQASGIIAREALEAAAEPSRFPGQIAAGLRPHRTPAAYQALYRPGDVSPFEISTGEFDPLFGRSWFQIAMASRSRHRSQDMGTEQPPGPHEVALEPILPASPDSPPAFYAGVDTTLSQRATRLIDERGADPSPRHASDRNRKGDLIDVMRQYESEVAGARIAYTPLEPGGLVTTLAAAVGTLDRARTLIPATGAGDFRFHIEAERDDAVAALVLASGFVMDAVADDPVLVPGQEFVLTIRLWNGGTEEVGVGAVEPVVPVGWTATAVDPAPTSVPSGQLVERQFRVRVAPNASFSNPYFLRDPRRGDMYAWPEDPALRGDPFQAGPIQARATVAIAGVAVALTEPATFVEVDNVTGEHRLPILVVPAAGVSVQPHVAVIPLGTSIAGDAAPDGERVEIGTEIVVTLAGEAPDGSAGTLRIETPDGWSVEPASVAATLSGAGARATYRFRVRAPESLEPGEYPIQAVFESGGERYTRGYDRIAYAHTNPRLLFRPAAVRFAAFPVQVITGLRVGYIEGAGDAGAAVLRQLGVEVELLDARGLAASDLGRFDAIVCGIRAYEVRTDLIANNARLLEYVRRGGTFIVQYNQQEFARGNFAPYPLTMARSAGRVTDEASPFRLLESDHAIFTRPNRIGPADFEGWVQERGLYFIESWAPEYTPLLGLEDPGEEEQRGSLLVARHGDGHYVYVALSFFRQWPAGVPGAYRLIANLVSLGT
ncbi:MAG: PIG-L family deacetylase [Longimicrobiales bacterium]